MQPHPDGGRRERCSLTARPRRRLRHRREFRCRQASNHEKKAEGVGFEPTSRVYTPRTRFRVGTGPQSRHWRRSQGSPAFRPKALV